MGRSKAIDGAPRVFLLAAVTLALSLALLVVTQPASASPDGAYNHGGASCLTCHPSYPTSLGPLNDATCTSCHSGGFQSRQTTGTATRTCWTCHAPGQDMTSVQATGCGTAAAGVGCHSGPAHFGSNAATCTSCHGVAQSDTDPGTSAHHDQTDYTAPATCTDCHTPAKGLHTDFVVGVACTTCHGGYDTTHPTPAAVKSPTVTLTAKPLIVKYGLTTILSGAIKSGTAGVAGKTVTLQQKPVGSVGFVTVTETTTGLDGAYAFVAQSPTMFTTYRIVAQGAVVSRTVVKPTLKTLDVKVSPVLTVALARTSIVLGGKQTIKGTLKPARIAGKVTLTIQRKVSGVWKTQLAKGVALSAASGYTTYSYPYKPLKRGSYRVKVSIAATTQLAAFTTTYKTWVVK